MILNYIILKELDDLYLEYWGCVMIWIYYDTTESWWFVFATILKGIDDLYAREDNQCNMFLYQEETTHLASHQNLSGATPLNINMIRTLWKLTITKKWKDRSTFQTSIKSGSMWKFVSWFQPFFWNKIDIFVKLDHVRMDRGNNKTYLNYHLQGGPPTRCNLGEFTPITRVITPVT